MLQTIVITLFVCSLANANPWPQGSRPRGDYIKTGVINGKEVTPHSHPYAVHIEAWGVCEGFLISDEWVVTIAQCIDKADSADLILGAHNIKKDEPEQVKMTSQDLIVHEYFHPYDFMNDIALVKLPEKVTLSDAIKPCDLPNYDILPGATAVLTGWGQTSESDPDYSDVLMEGDVTISNVSLCYDYYGQRYPKTVCVMIGSGSAPFCQGDFGGALYNNGAVHGIASFYSGAGCTSNGGDVYTRIYDFVDWIEEKTGVKPPAPPTGSS